jgi:polar amino acid transport system substrate-binding protein
MAALHYLLACALTALATGISPQLVAARPLDDVVASKVLRVILYDDNEPFSWSDGGEMRGIEVEIAKALAQKLGVSAEVILRPQGEKLDQDLRFNIVRGTLGGGIAGDVMLHVPVDKEMGIRVKEAVISNAYFQQRVALATRLGDGRDVTSFDVFKSAKVGVQLGTVADYFLMRYEGGALVANVSHYIKPAQGADRLANGDVIALLGVQSSLEALLKSRGQKASWSAPPMPGLVRNSWVLGTAVDERSRDLGHAIGAAFSALKSEGTLQEICGRYGITFLPPAQP